MASIHQTITEGPTGDTGATGSPSPLNVVQVTLNQSQILDLFNTPIQLVADPGADKCIYIVDVFLARQGDTTVFTGGGNITVGYSGDMANYVLYYDKTVLTQAGSATMSRGLPKGWDDTGSTSVSKCVHKAVQISNLTAVFADGAAGSELLATVIYYEADVVSL
jgi:hypothetical protein